MAVAPKAEAGVLSVSGASASSKTYDSTVGTTVDFTGAVLNGVDSGDVGNVSLDTSGYSASFSDKNAGIGKAVTVSGLALTGSAAYKYTLTQPTLSADIIARSLTVVAAGVNKTYDATANASATLSDNKVSGDNVLDFYDTASFADKNVGTNKTVSVTDIFITGTDSENYALANTTASATANISSKVLRVAATGQNKPYDGTTTASVILSDNHYASDSITDSYTSALFDDQYVGDGLTIDVSGISIGGPDAHNYILNTTTAHTQASITPRPLNVTAAGQNKSYDGTTNATVTLTNDCLAGDDITVSFDNAGFSDKNVGTNKTVSVYNIVITGPDSDSYMPASNVVTTVANISSRSLTVVATGQNKAYDGTPNAAVTLTDNRVPGDNLTDVYAGASFSDKNAGNGKTVTVTGISAAGPDAENYVLGNTVASTPANITARSLTVTATAPNKTYDGTANASVTLADNRVAGDTLTDSYTGASFGDKNVGSGKPVTAVGIQVSGSDSGNYTLSSTTASTTADITARTLTVAATAQNKMYDGTTTATVTLSDDHLAGDTITSSYVSANFAGKQVGNGITITVTGISIGGSSAGNYTLASTTVTTPASINLRSLTVTASGQTHPYDGTVNATVDLTDNRVPGDVLTDSYTSASFNDKGIGTGKTVTVTGIQVTGVDAPNYTLNNTTASTTANLIARSLTVTVTGQNKTYDGTTNASVTLADNRVAGDTLTDTYASAGFSDSNVGNGKLIMVSGIQVSGGDSGNYTLSGTTASTTANITGRTLTVSASSQNKTYDGTTSATVTLTDDHLAGDTITSSYVSASFAGKQVGTGLTITVTGISIGGTSAGNYVLAGTSTTTTANILARSLTVNATGQNKTYDGTTNASVTLGDNRVAGDSLTDTYSNAGFSDKNVGNGKTVMVFGIQVTGNDSGNYTLSSPTAATQANITAHALTVTATGQNKTYDGTVNATVTLSDNRVSGDVLTNSYSSASFADKNAGTGKTITITGIQTTGPDAANYSLGNTTATTTADITGYPLSVAAIGQNKVYDGTTNATVTFSDNQLAGDVITVTCTNASFSDKRVGSGKIVAVSGLSVSGPNAANYTLAATNTSTTASITARSLAVTATGINKVYDGTTVATVTLADNRVVGDVFAVSYGSASFATSAVGNGKTVSVSDIYIAGADAGNYSLGNTTASTTANITVGTTPAALTSSENPSGFHDLIAFAETLPLDATGTVTCFTNGVAFTSGSLTAGVFTSGSLSNLFRGTNVITAVYGGDANYAGITNVLNQVVTNHPPQTGYFTFSVTNGIALKLKISSLLTACIDVDGDPISLVSVTTSTNGMPVYTNSTLILFQNTNLVNDQFSYTVTDGQGGYATGQVAVVTVIAPFTGQNASLTPTGGTNYLTYHGIPGYTYVIERSVNFLTWVSIATNTAAFNGIVPVTDRFTDLGGPPASAFYRLKWVP